ncbi:MAG: lipopolysaccharide biosynthesis protein [Bacteroidaceae bacterium]|nr:lipopolysaccharide biosynthesis protein [Bacteroidaceae bacterium]
MANLKSLVKDTAIYGLSSIVGRFLNYLLVPLYTAKISAASGGYGVVTNMYAYTAIFLVLLTFGMETTLFRFANKESEKPDTVFSTAMLVVGTLTAVFLAIIFGFIGEISQLIGYADRPEFVLMMATVVALDALQAIPFSFLRFKNRAIRFASLKLLFIVLNIGINVLYFIVLGKTDVFYVFSINLVCTSFITLFFIPDLLRIRWASDARLLRQMLKYSWPILVLGIAGILNQTADKIIYPYVRSGLQGEVELGIYGACVKIAMVMAMITQAFRYAYEPFVFGKAKDSDSRETYAKAMKYFIIFTLLAFLVVVGWLDVLKYIIGHDYWEGLRVVPIVMAAEILMGVYFNLSFWYKLIDRTVWGLWFSLAGCAVLIAVNIIFIPKYGYMACAWGGVAGYGTATLLSYFVGQRKFPISYPLRSIAAYVLIAALFTAVMMLMPKSWPAWLRLSVNTALIIFFVAHIIWHDLPLKSLRRKD